MSHFSKRAVSGESRNPYPVELLEALAFVLYLEFDVRKCRLVISKTVLSPVFALELVVVPGDFVTKVKQINSQSD